jgi:hypothetical protein
MRIEEHVDEHVPQRLAIAADLVIAGASIAGGVLQPELCRILGDEVGQAAL